MSILFFSIFLLSGCEGWGSLITREEFAQWSREDTEVPDTATPDTDTSPPPESCEGLPQPTSRMEMVCIEPGTFMMGSPEAEVGRASDEDQHEVTLSGAFWIGAYEVTQAQFEDQMGYNPSTFSTCSDCPVEDVSWHEAAAFANELSEAEGLDLCYVCSGTDEDVECESMEGPYLCEGFRLPTEAEWEYAARAGEGAAFSNGGNLKEGDEYNCDGNLALDNGAELGSIAWYCGYSEGEIHPVGRLSPNAWGLYDMSGNVWEWTGDWYDNYPTGSSIDPVGSSGGSIRVNRSGSWGDDPALVRTANRGGNALTDRNYYLGVRLVRSSEPG